MSSPKLTIVCQLCGHASSKMNIALSHMRTFHSNNCVRVPNSKGSLKTLLENPLLHQCGGTQAHYTSLIEPFN